MCVNVSCFVFFATKKSSSGFPKEILRGAGQVEIGHRVAAAGGEPVGSEALWGVRKAVSDLLATGVQGTSPRDPGHTHLHKELMADDVIQTGPVLGVLGQHARYQVLSRGQQGGRHGVPGFSDAPVRLLQVRGFKRGSSQQHCVPGERKLVFRNGHTATLLKYHNLNPHLLLVIEVQLLTLHSPTPRCPTHSRALAC